MSTVTNVFPYDNALRDAAAPASLTKETSPKAKARLAGALFLATIVGGIVAQAFISDRFVVTGDAAATARNFAANQSLIRLAYAIFMIEMACQTWTTAAMYDLLMPVDRSLARTSAVFGYVGCGIKAMARLFFYAPLFVLGGASYFSAFDAKQLEAIAYLLIRINAQGTQIALIFFGVSTLMTGYLMYRATFLPRVLGVLSLIGGAAWLAFVYPPLGNKLILPIALFALIGCAVTIGWLLLRGVDEEKWYEMAAATSSSVWR
ncbi:MAG TPA: DUF4386 domain-containing protein [Gemmatimonadaceae bacterium]|nr:DUF4386 domain-containing protein [Gemmatimonadaceae bacterium]